MVDGGIIEIEVALAEHILELAGVEVPRVVAIEVPEDLAHLHLQVVGVQLI
jgi:hypothetical protein